MLCVFVCPRLLFVGFYFFFSFLPPIRFWGIFLVCFSIGPEVKRKQKKGLPPENGHTQLHPNTGDDDRTCVEGVETRDSLQGNWKLLAHEFEIAQTQPRSIREGTLPPRAVHSAPNSPVPRVRRQSKPANTCNTAAGVWTPPVPGRSRHAQHSRVPRLPVQETGSSHRVVMDEVSKPGEYSDMTGGSTGDSGFGEPLLKIPLPGEYI